MTSKLSLWSYPLATSDQDYALFGKRIVRQVRHRAIWGQDLEFQVPISTRGDYHRLCFIRGSLVPVDHVGTALKAERILASLGGDACPCVRTFYEYRKYLASPQSDIPTNRHYNHILGWRTDILLDPLLQACNLHDDKKGILLCRTVRRWKKRRWPSKPLPVHHFQLKEACQPWTNKLLSFILHKLSLELCYRNLCMPGYLSYPDSDPNKINFTFQWTDPHWIAEDKLIKLRITYRSMRSIDVTERDNWGAVSCNCDGWYEYKLTGSNRSSIEYFFDTSILADWVCTLMLSRAKRLS